MARISVPDHDGMHFLKKSWIHRGTILIRIGAHHIAFYRGYLEGLDLAVLSSRYLETATSPDPDLRVAKSTLKWIRDQLLVLARRSGRFADARLLLIEPERLRADRPRSLPTLEQFREDRDPYEMYTESELIALFEQEFGASGCGADRRTTRDERLRRRQIAALAALEKSIDARPALSDLAAGWIDPALAGRLAAAGIATLDDLVRTINGKGYRWWAGISRFGEKAAAQVVAWLKTGPVEKALGVALGPQASIKARQLPPALLERNRERKSGIVPLEFLLLPAELDGSAGENRGEDCKIGARNDHEAVQAWLSRKPAGSNTWRSYRKEAERLLLWAIIERRRALSSLAPDDCLAYRNFLWHLDPERSAEWPFRLPRDAWFGKRGARRWSELWRPFEGPLSEESLNLAITIVASMCRWLTDQRYLDSNPWDTVPAQAPVTRKGDATLDAPRSFSADQWRFLMRFLGQIEDDARRARLRFVLALAYATGLRLSEMVSARIGDLKSLDGAGNADSNGWMLVTGIGSRHRKVPLPSSVLFELDSYLKHRGLGDRFMCDSGVHLIGRLSGRPERDDGSAISTGLLYKVLKKFFTDAAESLAEIRADGGYCGAASSDEHAQELREMAGHLRKASTHWLRHTCRSQTLAANAGSAKPATEQGSIGQAAADGGAPQTEGDASKLGGMVSILARAKLHRTE
jgi:site-specific recombinase XerD